MVVAVLLRPVSGLVSLLCCVDPAWARKKHVDERVGLLYLRPPVQNITLFPSHTPFHSKPIGDWHCKACSSDNFVVRAENRICLFCGESSYYEAEGAVIQGSPGGARRFNEYQGKRVTHFKNWLARLQGKERCVITAEEIEQIRALVATYPREMSEYDQIKMALRALKLQKYYNHIYYIMRQIMGYSMVEFRKVNEARLLALFLRVQEPFTRVQKGRTNMLSYQFLIRKFCELLGYSLAKYIPTLKSRANLQQQDLIWRGICDELGLPFYPSV